MTSNDASGVTPADGPLERPRRCRWRPGRRLLYPDWNYLASKHLLPALKAQRAGSGRVRRGRGRCLGPATDIVERANPAGDRLGDGAFADAVAAADFRIVGKRRNGCLRVRLPTPGGEGLTEDQGVADGAHILTAFQQVEIPAAVGGIAIEDRADDLVVAHHHPLVDPARGVAQDSGARSRRSGRRD